MTDQVQAFIDMMPTNRGPVPRVITQFVEGMGFEGNTHSRREVREYLQGLIEAVNRQREEQAANARRINETGVLENDYTDTVWDYYNTRPNAPPVPELPRYLPLAPPPPAFPVQGDLSAFATQPRHFFNLDDATHNIDRRSEIYNRFHPENIFDAWFEKGQLTQFTRQQLLGPVCAASHFQLFKCCVMVSHLSMLCVKIY
jgi:hypothetical protein